MHFHFRYRVLIPLVLTFCLLAGCGAPASLTPAKSTETALSFDDFSEQFFRTEIASNTINLHFTLTNPENYGITDAPISLGSLSAQSADESRAALENTLAVLETFDYDKLSVRQQLDYDILSDSLHTAAAASELALYDEILRPSTGIQAQLPVLYEEYRFYEKEDVEDYLELIALTDSYFEEIIAFERRKAAAGLFMSDFACDNLISQCETFVKNPEEHYLIVTFNNKLAEMTDLSDAERADYQAKNETLVRENILPAYEKLANALTELLGSGTNDAGLCHLPEGKEYYEHLVRYNTGSEKSVREIQRMVEEQCSSDLAAASALMLASPTLATECNSVRLDGMDSVATLHLLQEQMLAHFPAAPDTKLPSAILTNVWKITWLLHFTSPRRSTIMKKILFLSTRPQTRPPCAILRRWRTRDFRDISTRLSCPTRPGFPPCAPYSIIPAMWRAGRPMWKCSPTTMPDWRRTSPA